MESGLLAQEAGAKVAEMILAAYDRDSGRWSLAKDDPFWSAVASAHSLARRGEGKRIAVVDGGFDMSIAASSRSKGVQGHGAWPGHGTRDRSRSAGA
jgi:hypothetical protein